MMDAGTLRTLHTCRPIASYLNASWMHHGCMCAVCLAVWGFRLWPCVAGLFTYSMQHAGCRMQHDARNMMTTWRIDCAMCYILTLWCSVIACAGWQA